MFRFTKLALAGLALTLGISSAAQAGGYGNGHAPTYHAPAYHAPAYHAPAYHAPAYRTPAYRAPAYHAPVNYGYHAPVYKQYVPAYRPAPVAVYIKAPTYNPYCD